MEKYNFRIRNLSAVRFQKQIIDHIDFDLREGEVHTVIGTTATDVSDFVDILEGGNSNISGNIIIGEKEYDAGDIGKWTKEIDHIRHENTLYDNLSIVHNLYLISRPFFLLNKKKYVKLCQKLLDHFDIHIDAETKVDMLTHEQKNIIELLRLYLCSKSTIVLHETLDYMDYAYYLKFQQIISKMQGEGKSFLYVTSKFEDIFKLSDRISFLSKGRISGTYLAEEVKKDPTKTMCLMSGWENFMVEENQHEEIHEMIDAIFKGTEILTSSYELRDVLVFIADNLAKHIQAKHCIIYIIDEMANNIIDTINNDDIAGKKYRLKSDFVERLAKSDTNKFFFANCTHEERKNYFEEENDTKSLMGVPIIHKAKVVGLIQVSYDKYYMYTEKDLMYIATMKNEIVLAIENSRLMGRSALLQESHHRIKNNLQIIISLLYMQKNNLRKSKEAEWSDAIDTTIYRIKSIAAVHDMLSNEKMKSSIVNLRKIITEIVKLYKTPRISLVLELDDAFMPYNKAASAALVINELINNCVKHAFGSSGEGIVRVVCRDGDEEIRMSVIDNGKGADEQKLHRKGGLGISIVESIVSGDFKGKIEYRVDHGTTVDIVFPKHIIYDGGGHGK